MGAATTESIRSRNGASEPSGSTALLSAEVVSVLHAALGNELADGGTNASPRLAVALRQLCDEAKMKGWPPEALLVAFKTAIDGAPAMERLTRGPERYAFRARIVSQCITAYFSVPQR